MIDLRTLLDNVNQSDLELLKRGTNIIVEQINNYDTEIATIISPPKLHKSTGYYLLSFKRSDGLIDRIFLKCKNQLTEKILESEINKLRIQIKQVIKQAPSKQSLISYAYNYLYYMKNNHFPVSVMASILTEFPPDILKQLRKKI